jgi:hypothetical protein
VVWEGGMKIEWTLKKRILAKEKAEWVQRCLENKILVNPNMFEYIKKHSQKGGHLYRG